MATERQKHTLYKWKKAGLAMTVIYARCWIARHWSFWRKEATVQVRHSTSHKVQSLHLMAGTIPEGT